MSATPLVYRQLLDWLQRRCYYPDLRHLVSLAWMVLGLIGSERLNLTAWEAHVCSRAQQAQSHQRCWHRFLASPPELHECSRNGDPGEPSIRVTAPYVPLLLGALQNCQGQHLYLAPDITVLRNRFCMVHLTPAPLRAVDPEPCFASKKAQAERDNRIWFFRIRSPHCHARPALGFRDMSVS